MSTGLSPEATALGFVCILAFLAFFGCGAALLFFIAANSGRPKVICPHCHVAGHVRVMPVASKGRVSGAKAAGAVLTLGAGALVTGVRKTEWSSKATCGNCGMSWGIK